MSSLKQTLLAKLRSPLHISFISKNITKLTLFQTKEMLNEMVEDDLIVESEKDYYVLKSKWRPKLDYGVNYFKSTLLTFFNFKIMEKKEMVNHPDHYKFGENNQYEVVEVCEAWGLDKDAYLFNVVKYVARAGKKDINKEVEDLKKAMFYLSRKINNLEKNKVW